MTHLVSPPIDDSKASLADIFLDREVPHRPVARPRSPRRRGRGQLGRHGSGAGPRAARGRGARLQPARVSPSQMGVQQRGSLALHIHDRRGGGDGMSREGGCEEVESSCWLPRSVGSQASRPLIGNLEGRLAMQRVGSRGRKMSGQIAGRRDV